MATVRAVFRNGLRHARILKQQPTASYSSVASADRKFNKPIDYATSTYLAHSPATALANKELSEEVRKTSTTKKMNLFQAINDGLSTVLDRDEKACVFGEDVSFGGVFRCTMGLQERFGGERVFNTPLTEQGLVGFAIGLAAQGHTALAEIQFADYMFPAFDQLHNEASKMRYRSGGAEKFTSGRLLVRMPAGGVGHGALYHSQSPEGFFLGCQGLKVVIPRGPIQAKGLLLSAVESPDPVVFMEPKILYRAAVEHVPTDYYTLPIGKAEILKPGKDITLISYGTLTYACEMAAKHAKEQLGLDVEVIDLRTVHPWDRETVFASVNKTGRCVVVHEASRSGGIGESVAGDVQENCFLRLEAPVARVTGWDVPNALQFEDFMIPDVCRKFPIHQPFQWIANTINRYL
ncbi:thiamine diphosphate-binding protein [Ascobolus immersus RN42]|uniref:3-methyl-2-oxobutanoate dehydrogenase (2-methylpropanoyl-transferring) n=1 Tax=Ascobolus immersus RN42 TaxID=1160509 RepID=A0A3N4HVP6_ASCIM|nr:thiamine diphosphate-binding protein [Ascobolus immersus RN42]